MSNIRCKLISTVGLLTALLANSSTANITPNIQQCYDKANDTASAYKCANKDFKYLDASLNKTHKKLIRKLDKSKQYDIR